MKLRAHHYFSGLWLLASLPFPGLICSEPLRATILNIQQLAPDSRHPHLLRNPLQLSGMAAYKNRIFVIGDKAINSYLYEIQDVNNRWEVVKKIKIPGYPRPEYEGMAFYKNMVVLVDEGRSLVERFILENDVLYKAGSLELELPESYIEHGKSNRGFEGVAVNEAANKLYLVKEREPRSVIHIDIGDNMNLGKIEAQYDIHGLQRADAPASFSGLYFENDFLYVIERRDYLITKIDVNTKEPVSQLSYEYIKDESGSIYENESRYGNAEALLLTKNEILIGFDNNGNKILLNNTFSKKYGLSGNQPAIIRMVRPSGF